MVYDWRVHVAYQSELIGATKAVKVYFLYPPPFLLTTIVFARLGLVAAYLSFLVVTAFSYALALRLVTKSWLKAVFGSLAGGGAYISLLWVQNGLLTAALFTGALVLLPKRPVMSGILFGALSVKPQLGMLIPFVLIAGRHWRVFASAAVTCVLLAGGSALVFGAGIWSSFFHSLAEARDFLETGSLWFKMQSPFALTLPLLGKAAAYGVQTVVALLVLWILIGLWKQRALPWAYKNSALLSGSLLVSPYIFSYDATILSAAALMLACQAECVTILEAALMIVALVLPGFTETLHSAATPIASLIMLLLSLRLSVREQSTSKATLTEPTIFHADLHLSST
jgi:hypothetical protein